MRAVKMFHYKGFLVRICDNGSPSHPYEWTVQPISVAAKRAWDAAHEEFNKSRSQSISARYAALLRPRWFPLNWMGDRYLRIANKGKRSYDPTSHRFITMAVSMGKDEVDGFYAPRDTRPYFNR